MTNTNSQTRDEQSAAVGLLRVLRRRMAIIIVCAIALPAGALVFSLLQQKQYSAASSLLFRDPQFDQKLFGSVVVPTSVDPAREAATNVELVSLDVVADRTARQLGGGLTASGIKGEVQVAPAGKSDVVSITATDTDPRQAAHIANTFANQYIAFRRDADRSKIRQAQILVQDQIGKLTPAARQGARGRSLESRAEQLGILASLQTGNAELVQQASVPVSASSPRPLRNTVLGGILGVLLGLGLALLFERFDRRLKDPDDISLAFDRPILGAIPESRNIARARTGTVELGAGESEAFRMLRANLRYFNVDQRVKSVLITSAAPAEGKSTVAVHLASAAASAGSHVLLLEADLRRPTLASKLGITPTGGLSLVLSGNLALDSATQRVPVVTRGSARTMRTMDVVVAGPIPPNPADLIESERMRSVIQAAEREYDLVVVDTPPTSVVSDAIPLVKEVSGVMVVTRVGKTTRESAAHLRRQLENLDAHTLGIVVNSVGSTGGYGYGYGYGYTGYEPTIDKNGHDPNGTDIAEDRLARNGHVPSEPVQEPAPRAESTSALVTSGRSDDYESEPDYGERGTDYESSDQKRRRKRLLRRDG